MINLTNVTKYYGDFLAVDDISVNIKEGEITGLLGPNGAGKTSTMRMITGYLNSDSGDIKVDNISVAEDPIGVKKLIGYLPESAPIYNDMLVYDYLNYVGSVRQVENLAERIKETARQCGLSEVMYKNISELSKGYKQRVGLGQAIIHDPKILILDEPTTGLDPNQIIDIRNLIKEIGKTKTIIISTHILQEVEAICDRVVIINRGNIIKDSSTAELKVSHGDKTDIMLKVKGTDFSTLSSTIKSIDGVVDLVERNDNDNLVTAIVASTRDVRPDIFNSIKSKDWVLYEMAIQKNSLEKVFRDLTVGGE